MLYLIQVQNDDLKLLKIGYTSDLEKRISQYRNHNPLLKVIATREGDEILEKLLHIRFQEYQYPDYGNEWFYRVEEILRQFELETEETLLDWLWSNRSEVLDLSYFNTNNLQNQILTKLYSSKTSEDLDWRNKFDNLWDRKSTNRNQVSELDDNSLLGSFMFDFNNLSRWNEKMKLYCDFLDQYGDLFNTTDIGGVPREFQNYVNLLGTKRVKALEYRKNELENEYKIIASQDQLKSHILFAFNIGRYVISDIKEKLQSLYNSLGIKKKAKATDLGEYFEIKSFVTTISGKAVRCIELIKLNSNVISDTSTE